MCAGNDPERDGVQGTIYPHSKTPALSLSFSFRPYSIKEHYQEIWGGVNGEIL